MTTIRAVEDRLHLLAASDDAQPVRDHCYQAVVHALSDLFEHLGQPVEQIDLLRSIDPTKQDQQIIHDLTQVHAQISEQYATSHATHLTAKKAWSLAMNRVYQVQASEKATDKQITAAVVAEQEARIPFEETLEKFMQARRAEESFRHALYAYQAQTLPAVTWLAHHVLRVHTYTKGTSDLTSNLLRELPTP